MPLRLPKLFKPKAKSFGKKRELKISVKDKKSSVKKDSWPYNGGKERYKQIFFDILKRQPINHLIKNKNSKPSIMILGPGEGGYIHELQAELAPYKIKPRIDVLGLQKTIDPALLKEKTVRRDFSKGQALEEISENPKVNKKLISIISEKYDLVMAPASVGLHTLYPAFNVFNVSCMLRKGGVAYIEVPTTEVIKRPQFKVPEKHKARMIAQLEKLPEVVTRFLENYKGKEYSQEFRFSKIDYELTELNTSTGSQKDIERRYIRYIKVERK